MKKFGLFISIALLTAFVGCDSDDVEDPVVPAVSKPVVAVSENTPTSFGVEWDAVDEAAGYQYVVTESDAAGNTSEFCPETQTDKTSLRFDDAAAGAKYTVKVKALAAADSQLADSEYAEIFVETPAEGLSSQTFAFTVDDPVGYDSATVKVEPSIADETYFFAVVKSSLLLDKNSNAIIEMLKKDIEPESLVKGEQTIETKWLDPETAYVAVAFGYDADRGASTSVLSRSEKFSTAVDPRMSIDVSVMNAGDEAISAKCVPSGSGSYFVTAVKSADVAGMSDHEILDAQLAALNAEIDKSGWDAVAAAQFRSGTSNYNASGLSIGTEYSVVAFGVQKSAAGKAEETTRLFKANTKTTAPEAVVEFTMNVIDGSQFVDPQPGIAGVGFQFEPNAATKTYAFSVYYETILESGYSDSDFIAMMTGDPASMIDAATDPEGNFRGYYPFEWGERAVVMTVGLNALGQPGPLQKKLIEITKDGQGGGGNEPTEPIERGDASLTFEHQIVDGGSLDPQYSGYPTLVLQFKPDAKCVDYRWAEGLVVNVVEQFGEDVLLSTLFLDESLKSTGSASDPDLTWNDRSMTSNDVGGTIYFPSVLGESFDVVAVAFDADKLPGKMVSATVTFPSSLDPATVAMKIPTSSVIRSYKKSTTLRLLDRTSRLKRYDLK
ncbi:fibronectin type III domain-containing protein [Alistipes communis]|uniref:fibronectin type III domain-containing protein n=1 Tax=Alistipes communis TaxID=2585118 RepID=UPI00307CC513